ncbi:putative bacteriophage protein [Escherichia coli]|nr:putative bacteriophage protein [Escherichia coli]
MEIKPEDELSNIVLFPVKEDDPRNQVNFLYEPSERPYCHHASVRVDEKERQVRCKICGAVVEPFDWMLSVAKRETRLADDVKLLRQEEQERRKNITSGQENSLSRFLKLLAMRMRQKMN